MRITSNKRKFFLLVSSAAVLMPLFAATYYAAFLLRFAGEPIPRAADTYFSTLLWVVIFKWLCCVWFHLHRGWTRFVGFDDLLIIAQAVTYGALTVTLFDALCLPQVTIPRSVILIDWGTTLLLVSALRALPRMLRNDWQHLTSTSGPVALIVGATDSGETLLRAIRSQPALKYRIIGFIDDQPHVQGCRIGGIPVLGTCHDLPHVARKYSVEQVLITAGELPGKQVRRLMNTASEHGFSVKVLPSYEQLLAGRVDVRPREVAIEDLLHRDTLQLDLNAIRGWLSGRVIMVTGSAGSIGSEICRQLLKLRPARLVLVDRAETGQFYLERELQQLSREIGNHTASEATESGISIFPTPTAQQDRPSSTVIDIRLADLTDTACLANLFAETRPEVVFHAAAYKHVPLMEAHCGEAVKNIVLATRNLVDLAEEHRAQALVMISTDKAVNPTSVMGACKRLAEHYVQARSVNARCRFITVRFGNVLDSSGSVVPIFREQIARGGPLTITHPEITRYFMLIPEAAQLVIQAGAMGQGGEIFVLDMGEPVRILDLAYDMIRLSGLHVGEDIEVKVVGLRPGEKLYEELYETTEAHRHTAHPKIMVATSTPRTLFDVRRDIRRLEMLLYQPNDLIKAALREIVPLQSSSDALEHRAAA